VPIVAGWVEMHAQIHTHTTCTENERGNEREKGGVVKVSF